MNVFTTDSLKLYSTLEFAYFDISGFNSCYFLRNGSGNIAKHINESMEANIAIIKITPVENSERRTPFARNDVTNES